MPPDNAFNPKPRRSANHRADSACHVPGSTARFGLTRVPGIMPNFIALLVTALLLAMPGSALACTILPDEPARIFQGSDSIVLAEPVEISTNPEEAGRYQNVHSYQQTVVWKVVKAWKGTSSAGERFATTARISTGDPCSAWDVIRDYQPRILRSVADGSFQLYHADPLSWAAPQLDALREEHDPSGERP